MEWYLRRHRWVSEEPPDCRPLVCSKWCLPTASVGGKKTWLAFFDLKKAYDSVWKEGLWEKMDKYGLGVFFLI